MVQRMLAMAGDALLTHETGRAAHSNKLKLCMHHGSMCLSGCSHASCAASSGRASCLHAADVQASQHENSTQQAAADCCADSMKTTHKGSYCLR